MASLFKHFRIEQITLSYFVRESITVCLTSCLTGLDSAALLMYNQKMIYLFSQIQTSQAGQPYSDTSPYEVSESSLDNVTTLKPCTIIGLNLSRDLQNLIIVFHFKVE